MNKRTWKEFIKKRSTIWTLSLCLVGIIVLGGISAVNNSRNQEEVQTESDADQVAYLEEEVEDRSDAADDGNLEEVSGSTVEEGSSSDGTSADSGADGASTEVSSGSADGDASADDSSAASDVSSTDVTADTGSDTGDNSGSAEVASDSASGDSEEASSAGIISEQTLLDAGISFSEEESLLWPSAGTIVIDYSMDKSVYFATLNQYKYNPALIISSSAGNQVLASAKGIVESIYIDEETGTTLVLNIGNGYKLTYGQLMEPAVAEGDIVESGDLLAYVSEPTKYYSIEGSNLYFQMTKDGEPVDPVLYLE